MTTSHNIAFYCSSISWGGLEMNFVRYAGWMQENGNKVTVFCVADSPIHQHLRNTALTVIVVERNRKYLDIKRAMTLNRLLKECGAEWVWFRDNRDLDLIAFTKRLSGNGFKVLYQQAMQLGVEKKDPIHTWRFTSIDTWVSTLDHLKAQVLEMTRMTPESIVVIPLGTDATELKMHPNTLREKLNIPNDSFVTGVIGRIDPLKDQLCAINAFALLEKRFPKMHLIIMGESTRNEEDHYESDLRKKIRSLHLESRIHFLPYSHEVGSFYQAIQLFLLTSKKETFGTVTIEAMSFGLPIIGTHSGGTPEILEHGKSGLLYEPGNADDLAEQWQNIMTDHVLRSNLSDRALLRFQTYFSRQASVKALQKVLDSK